MVVVADHAIPRNNGSQEHHDQDDGRHRHHHQQRLTFRKLHPKDRASFGIVGVPGIAVFDLRLFANGRRRSPSRWTATKPLQGGADEGERQGDEQGDDEQGEK